MIPITCGRECWQPRCSSLWRKEVAQEPELLRSSHACWRASVRAWHGHGSPSHFSPLLAMTRHPRTCTRTDCRQSNVKNRFERPILHVLAVHLDADPVRLARSGLAARALAVTERANAVACHNHGFGALWAVLTGLYILALALPALLARPAGAHNPASMVVVAVWAQP